MFVITCWSFWYNFLRETGSKSRNLNLGSWRFMTLHELKNLQFPNLHNWACFVKLFEGYNTLWVKKPNSAKSNIISQIHTRSEINSKMELMNWTCFEYFLARTLAYDEYGLKLGGLEGRLTNNMTNLVKFQSEETWRWWWNWVEFWVCLVVIDCVICWWNELDL